MIRSNIKKYATFATCMSAAAVAAQEIPVGQNHVYSDIVANSQGRISMPVHYGDNDKVVNLYLSMQQPQTFIVDKTCQTCKTNNTYEYRQDATHSSIVIESSSGSVTKFDQKENKMINFQVTGAVYQDDMTIKKGEHSYGPIAESFLSIQDS